MGTTNNSKETSKIYANYFGSASLFVNDGSLGDNSYQLNGITTGFKGRKSIGVQKDWIAKKNAKRASDGLTALSLLFGTSFTNVKDAQKYLNQMLKQASIRTGADFGSISTDGKWGDLTQLAFDLVKKVYEDAGNNWNSDKDSEYTDVARNQYFLTTPIQPSKPILKPALNTVNRAIVRQGLHKVNNGIRNTDELRIALLDPNATEFMKDLAVKLQQRGYDINTDEGWERALQDMNIKGHIGRHDRKNLRKFYNMNNYVIKNQQGGQLSQEDQIKQAFAEFCKENNLEPNAESWEQFKLYLKQLQEKQTQMAKLGAKLNYLRSIQGKCPEGYLKYYFKAGGRICSACKGMELNKSEYHTPKKKYTRKAISSVVADFRNS